MEANTSGQRRGRRRFTPRGRALDGDAHAQVTALLGDSPRRRDLLIEFLHRIQDHFGHLSAAHLNALAVELRLAQAEVYEVATFYHHFDVVREGEVPPPALTVRVCDSVACALAGADELLAELRERFGNEVRVTPAPCIGQCDRAPAVAVATKVIGAADADQVAVAVHAGDTEAHIAPYVRYAEYRAGGGYALLQQLARGERQPGELLGELEASRLRGLGGAGFPSARKWSLVRAEEGPRVVVLNADEGEPGTFKDRFCLETDPHRVLEGLLLAARVVEASSVFIYLRDEYAGCRAILERELAALQSDPPCELPVIEMRRGAGAYICGEETALIESIEGRRGEPRLKPPFPAQHGVFGRPTLVHNVETMYWLRQIFEQGSTAFAASGLRGRAGSRLFSVSGRVQRPGAYVAGAGVTARELIEMAGGMQRDHDFYAFLPGGASGGILPARLGDVPLDFDALAEYGSFIGSAAIVVLSQADRARDVAQNLMRFFAHESCGKCTPCRVGTAKAVQLMAQERWNEPLLAELGGAMSDASICGLGQAAPNPVRSVMTFFSQELRG